MKIVVNNIYNMDCVEGMKLIDDNFVDLIIEFTTKEGDLVLDPFLGSGQTAVASRLLKRKYLGFEEAFVLAKHRVENDIYFVKKNVKALELFLK